MISRNQQHLKLALRCVQEVEELRNTEVSQAYGRLCHSFPMLVQSSGLCQAVMFSQDKSTSQGKPNPRQQAHQLLLKHLAEVLEVQGSILHSLQNSDTLTYMHHTRQVLHIWVYFKRFAVSVLKVEQGQDEDRADA